MFPGHLGLTSGKVGRAQNMTDRGADSPSHTAVAAGGRAVAVGASASISPSLPPSPTLGAPTSPDSLCDNFVGGICKGGVNPS